MNERAYKKHNVKEETNKQTDETLRETQWKGYRYLIMGQESCWH
jgi:hypothetical protein